MRTYAYALAFAALLAAAPAFANPCVGTNITNCNAGSDDNINNVSNKAYGGAGGNATATGGTASASQSQSQSQSATADNAGNSQTVNFDNKRQVPATSSFVAASGPCVGAGGGFNVGTGILGLGFAAVTLETQCQQRELLRLGFASNDPEIQAKAKQGWMQMFGEDFKDSTGKSGSTQTSALAPAPATEQTASLPEPALPKGQTRN